MPTQRRTTSCGHSCLVAGLTVPKIASAMASSPDWPGWPTHMMAPTSALAREQLGFWGPMPWAAEDSLNPDLRKKMSAAVEWDERSLGMRDQKRQGCVAARTDLCEARPFCFFIFRVE